MKKYRFLMSMLVLLLASSGCGRMDGKTKDNGKTCDCSYFNLSQEASWQTESFSTNISGHLRMDNWPLHLENARFFLFVNEKSSYSDEYVRIIEQEFSMLAEQEVFPAGTCGNDDYDYPDDDYEYSAALDPSDDDCECDVSWALYSQVEPAPRPAATVSIYTDASYVGPIPFEVLLHYPDRRSEYSIEILIDLDRDGVASAGDRQTSEGVAINHLSGETNLLLDLIEVGTGIEPVEPLPTDPTDPIQGNPFWAHVLIEDHSQLDGCGFLLTMSDGAKLEPINLDPELAVNGLHGNVVYVERPDLASICMAAKVVQVLDFELLGDTLADDDF